MVIAVIVAAVVVVAMVVVAVIVVMTIVVVVMTIAASLGRHRNQNERHSQHQHRGQHKLLEPAHRFDPPQVQVIVGQTQCRAFLCKEAENGRKCYKPAKDFLKPPETTRKDRERAELARPGRRRLRGEIRTAERGRASAGLAQKKAGPREGSGFRDLYRSTGTQGMHRSGAETSDDS